MNESHDAQERRKELLVIACDVMMCWYYVALCLSYVVSCVDRDVNVRVIANVDGNVNVDVDIIFVLCHFMSMLIDVNVHVMLCDVSCHVMLFVFPCG